MLTTLECIYLELTSTEQWGYGVLLKEPTGAIDEVQTHVWQEPAVSEIIWQLDHKKRNTCLPGKNLP